MANENANQNREQNFEDTEPIFDYEELQEKLESQLDELLGDLESLKEEKEKIGSPDTLGNVIMDVVWEQFLNQVAVTAGEDFIKENHGMLLDLRKKAHIQTSDNFANGVFASHNVYIDYEQRNADMRANFVKDRNGKVVMHPTRTGREEPTVAPSARKVFDKDRPSGSAERHTDMDHTISAAEIMRDHAAYAHMSVDELIKFANSDANLAEMDSSLNRSKRDKSMTEWLDTPNSKGQKPSDIFDISPEDEANMRQNDKKAREEYNRQKREGEQKSNKTGKQSRKEEAFRIRDKALRTAIMTLLAELVREIILNLVKWFKSAKRELKTLLGSIKEAIYSFITKLKTNLIDASKAVFTTLATAIWGPIFITLKKVWMMLKQGWNSLKKAINYIKDPANKGKPISILLMEVGKILVAGLAGAGGLVLGEVIEKGLMTIPIFAVEIPLLGSLANILGIFLGAVVAGIIGAIAINLIEKHIEKRLKRDNVDAQLDKRIKILRLQYKIKDCSANRLVEIKNAVANSMVKRHRDAAEMINASVNRISENLNTSENIDDRIDKLSNELDNMLTEG